MAPPWSRGGVTAPPKPVLSGCHPDRLKRRRRRGRFHRLLPGLRLGWSPRHPGARIWGAALLGLRRGAKRGPGAGEPTAGIAQGPPRCRIACW